MGSHSSAKRSIPELVEEELPWENLDSVHEARPRLQTDDHIVFEFVLLLQRLEPLEISHTNRVLALDLYRGGVAQNEIDLEV